MRHRRPWGGALLLAITGCHPAPVENIPHYGLMPAAGVLDVLDRRAAATHTVSGEAAITLTRPDGQSVQLDGAIALALPASARVRAWKFGQAVFDLTLTPAGVWIFSSQNGPPPTGAGTAIGQWVRLLGGDFSDWTLAEDRADRLSLRREMSGGIMRCDVDRATATPRHFSFVDSAGKLQFQMLLSHYTVVNGLAWPGEVLVTSSGGRIQIDWRDVQMNQPVPTTAFRPPARAVCVAGGLS